MSGSNLMLGSFYFKLRVVLVALEYFKKIYPTYHPRIEAGHCSHRNNKVNYIYCRNRNCICSLPICSILQSYKGSKYFCSNSNDHRRASCKRRTYKFSPLSIIILLGMHVTGFCYRQSTHARTSSTSPNENFIKNIQQE